MAIFITRVELHHPATSADYPALHTAMERVGFSRTLLAADGYRYHLPQV
jgi:hypothetical protein